MSGDLLKDAQEEALFKILGKSLNDYISKHPMPPYRIFRILTNMMLAIINNSEKESE